MLRKDSYPYESRHSCNKQLLYQVRHFYSNLIIKGITELAYGYINKGLYIFCKNI